MWNVEITDEFLRWWETLEENQRTAVERGILILESTGPFLGRPRADTVKGSRHPNMKELRCQTAGQPLRYFFAFDPRRSAILLS